MYRVCFCTLPMIADKMSIFMSKKILMIDAEAY
jgi:hypothetical protein